MDRIDESFTETRPGPAARRYAGVDALKAAAIATVVFIHVFVSWTLPPGSLLWWMGSLTRFAVPAFLFCAGFLTIPGDERTGRRLKRVLVPYLVASSFAWLWRARAGLSPDRIVLEAVTGGAINPYYFVSVYVVCVLLSAWLARRGHVLHVVLALSAGAAVAAEAGWLRFPGLPAGPDLYWQLRNPLLWLVYFAAGMETRRLLPWIDAWTRRARIAMATGFALAWTASVALSLSGPPVKDASFVLHELARTWLVIAAGLLAFHGADSPRPLRWLSEASYPVYLYHLLVLALCQPLVLDGISPPWPVANPFARYAIAFGGTILLVLVARRLLGERARTVIG